MSGTVPASGTGKGREAFRTIREVSAELGVPQHVLRFWETRFPELKPLQRGGNRRYYRPGDVAFAAALHQLLHRDGYTVKGVRRLIDVHGASRLPAVAGQERAPAVAGQERASAIAGDERMPAASTPPVRRQLVQARRLLAEALEG